MSAHRPSAAFIDTHCHLDMFGEDRDVVIERAKNAGIEAILTISSDLESNIRNIDIAGKYDCVYASVGIHPHDARDFTEEIYNQLRVWIEAFGMRSAACGTGRRHDATEQGPESPIRNRKVVALGETGLDYHYEHSPRETQREVFRKHLTLAGEADLPVIVHSREAKEDTLEILKDSGIYRGVLHCFSGDREMAEKAMDMGFFISIAGPVTFRNAGKLLEIARMIPDDALLVETDAPFLTPEPLRGKRNEPAFLVHTIEKIAELRGVSSEDIMRITTINARRLFNIGELPQRGEIAYKIRDALYLNITNRCTNRCSFCVKFHTDYVKGHNLRLYSEPTEEELKCAIGEPSRYREIVFCGYGEPLIRLDVVKNIARWIKDKGGHVRINTNGHGNLIHRRNILMELEGIVDAVSVSLDAQDEETYNRLCEPAFRNAFSEIIAFIGEAKKRIPRVQATVVETNGVDVEKCRKITDELGVPLKVRRLDTVG